MKNKIAAGLLSIFLGAFGVHKFYLGQNKQGVFYLLFCWTYIPFILGIVEGIKILLMDDTNFIMKYSNESWVSYKGDIITKSSNIQRLTDEEVNLFREIELEGITGEIVDDNYKKITIRKNGSFLGVLKAEYMYFSSNTSSFVLDMDFRNYSYFMNNEEFTILHNYIISNINIENAVILELEEWLYKYEIFKREYYPKIKIDFDIIAKLEEAKKEKIIENLAEKDKQASRYIPQSVKNNVWNRDGGKCVECGSKEKLEFDHIVPFSKGGANTERNLQLLCEKCNRNKSDKIG